MKREHVGQYVDSQYGQKTALVPADLPPDPPFDPSLSLVRKIEDTHRIIGSINQTMQSLPQPKAFVRMFIRYESSRSSEIENIDSNVDDILDFEVTMAIENDPKKSPEEIFDREEAKSLREVFNHIEASYQAYQLMDEQLPFSKRLHKTVHETLMAGEVRGHARRPGEFRSVQNYIGDKQDDPEDAWHIPPPPQEIESCLDNLEHFVHDRSEDAYPAMIKAGMAHVQFETIHPFLDGNGRVGRLMVPLVLRHEGILDHPVYYLSQYFRDHQEEYYERLNQTQHEGTWEEWMQFFMDGMLQISHGAQTTLKETVGLYNECYDRYSRSDYRLTDATERGLEYLFVQPKFTVNQFKEGIDSSYQTASNIIQRFCNLGFIGDVTNRDRGTIYSFEPYMDIFRTLENQTVREEPETIHVQPE